jgi:hypothetical protein
MGFSVVFSKKRTQRGRAEQGDGVFVSLRRGSSRSAGRGNNGDTPMLSPPRRDKGGTSGLVTIFIYWVRQKLPSSTGAATSVLTRNSKGKRCACAQPQRQACSAKTWQANYGKNVARINRKLNNEKLPLWERKASPTYPVTRPDKSSPIAHVIALMIYAQLS